MSDPIKVSAKDFERLEMLQAMREGPKAVEPVKAAASDEKYQAWLKGGKGGKRDVAGEALDFGKKIVFARIVWGIVLIIVGAITILPFILRCFGDVERNTVAVHATASAPTVVPAPNDNLPTVVFDVRSGKLVPAR